ncbi:PKD domain-containing protein [Dermatobacter hominis]|uniref:PKD domain-containing protein n=1 Tax=Dermatobacter hominis TaxID=2884263 RepID=UPI001D0FEF35|nr:PKD domain-containing protein [Dermatobacter hominis]UDY35504.1 PKD domain-containing protein [Dermatobacter hominis]
MSGTSESPHGTWMRRIAAMVAALMVTSVFAVAAGTGVAGADTAPIDPAEPETVAADLLPTVQINGVVWDTVVVGNTVYATGSFTSARPAGSAAGTNETPRGNVLAFNLTTGALITTWSPSLNAQGRTIAASADGTTIFVGGDFTQVNGTTTRNRLAAFDATTGALRSFNPNVNANVNDLAVSGNTLYLAGAFTVVSNQLRSRLAAVNASTGALLQWAPSVELEAHAIVAPNGPVVVGGKFQTLNDTPVEGLGAVDPVTGATVPWAANQIIGNYGPDAYISSLSTNGNQVFGTGVTYLVNGQPTSVTDGNLEATFAADAATGALQWASGCLGDHYDSYAQGNVLYNVSHSHNCSSVGGHPQEDPWTFQRAQAETIYPDPTGAKVVGGKLNGLPRAQQLHWLPTLAQGTFTGQAQAAWTIEGNSQYLVLGGEFPRVNGTNQQGLARFATKTIAPNKDAIQGYPELTPTLVAISPGSLRVSWQGAWDRDNARLTYEVLRGDTVATSTVLKTITFDKSNWWTRPKMAFVDTTAPPGSTQTYRIRVRDPWNNGFASLPTTGTIPEGTATSSAYRNAVMADSPTKYWRLGEPTGTIGYDQVGADDLTLASAATRNVAGALIGDTDTSTTFPGSGSVPGTTTGSAQQAPQDFTVEAWFKTNTTRGGKIVGYGNRSTGLSSSYDRHIYMTNGGQLRFGVYNGSTRTIATSTSYNNNQWHHAVGQLGPSGMKFYVDGKLIGTDASATSAEAMSGYWRVGGDELNSWPSAPTSDAFAGTIDEVAVYQGQLTQDQIRAHYLTGGYTPTWPTRPTDTYGGVVWDANPDIYLRLNETSGSAASNRMTNEQAATATGTAWLGAASPADPTGSSVNFNSSNDRVVGTTQYSNPTTFSLETWIRTTDTNGGRIIGFGDGTGQTSSNYDRHLYLLSDGRLRYGVWTGVASTIDSPMAVNNGQWHHVVVTQQPGEQKMYVDGALVASGTASVQQSYNGYWRLGTDNIWDGDRNYIGLIDEAAVYSTVVSPQTVVSHWTAAGGQAPNVNPTASFTAGATDLVASFDAGNSLDPDGSIVNYAWNFGDGQSTSGATATANHTYVAGGTYNVTLTVTDNRGGTATTSAQITVLAANQLPTAAFTTTTNHLSADFDASTSTDADGSVVSYSWDFGDGTTGTGIAPSHTYAAAATYNVTLTVTDNRNGTNTVTHPVTATLPPNVLPTATFTSSTTNLTANFDATGSTDPDGTIQSYAWDFGDGQQGSGATASHTYAAPGPYTVKLTVIDDRSGQATHTEGITVQAPPNVAPTASFTSGHTDLTANFDATLSSDPDGTIVSYSWDFGDSTGSASVAPNHTYATGGTYSVTLTVTDDDGATHSVTHPVTVTNPPPANISPTASFTSSTSFLSAQVNGGGSSDPDGSVVSYSWNWGDGATTTGATSSHTYAIAGTYTVTLTVTDDDGATGTITGQVTVNAPPANVAPTASFTANANNLTAAVDASASSDTDGTIVSYSWNWGDSTAAGTGAAATHSYATGGTYTITLTVTDDDGATATTTRQVTVNAPTVSNYAADTFSRTVSNGLGSAELGGAWTGTGTAAGYSVTGGVGLVSVTAGASRTISLNSVAATDTEVSTRIAFDKAQTGGGTYVAVLGRRVNATNDYRLKLRVQAGGVVSAQLVRIVNGTETVIQNLATVPGLTWNANEFLKVRFQVTGTNPTNLAAKVWKDGTAEPGAWQLQSTDTTAALQASGSVGIWDYLSGTSTNGPIVMSVDDFVAGPVGGVTPPPANVAPTASFTTGTSNLTANVDGSGSSDTDGTIASYSWNWGDSTANGTGATANHAYATGGTYTITLTVTDDDGATATTTRQVTVSSAPAPTNFAQDAFARTASNGWGTADVGGAWSVTSTASNYSVSGGVGRISMAAGANRNASLNSVSQSAVDVKADLAFDKAQTGGGSYVAVVGRRIDASNDYRLKLRVQTGGAVTAQLVRVVNGTETVIQSIATVPGLTWNANEVLKVRFQVSGTGTTNLAAKVWKDGTAEPAAWQLSSADTTAALQAAGGVGIWSYLSGTATNAPMTLLVDNFTAGPLG